MATASDVMLDTLQDWGVEVIFGLPGDGIDGVIEALRQREEQVRFIQVRHEESAAFMACAYAKYTGKLGVCLATTGPGGIHLLNGLYDAKLDGQPVLAITGLPFHDLIGTATQQDVELDKVFEDVAAYSMRIMGPSHVENVTHLACRTALAYHTVTHVSFPIDFQSMDAEHKGTKRNVPGHASDAFSESARLPRETDLDAAAAVLNAGKKIVILAGRGALGATDVLESTAEKLAAPIVKPLLGKAAVPDDSPFTTGGIGLLGTAPSQQAMEDCDTLLMVGTSFPYVEFYPKPDQARAVQIELDPKRIGLRYPVEVGVVGDSKRCLEALLPRLERKADRGFLEEAQASMVSWRERLSAQEGHTGTPMKPQTVAAELGRHLTDDAIVSADSGTVAVWWARHTQARRNQMFSLSGTLASMANGLPYAIAAQIAYPNRQCVAFVGDGGFSMLMAEFATCVKYNLPVKVVILKNNSFGMIKWEQMVFLGNPEFACDLQPIDFAAFARACGGSGFSVDDPNDIGRVFGEAFSTDGPVIVQAVVDPHEPPMPAKVTPEQALKFGQAMLRGQPNREKIALTVVADKVRELI